MVNASSTTGEAGDDTAMRGLHRILAGTFLLALVSCSSPRDKPAEPEPDKIVGKWEEKYPVTRTPGASVTWEFTSDGKMIKESHEKGNPDGEPLFRITGSYKRVDESTLEIHYDRPFGDLTRDKVDIVFNDEELLLAGRGYKAVLRRIK